MDTQNKAITATQLNITIVLFIPSFVNRRTEIKRIDSLMHSVDSI